MNIVILDDYQDAVRKLPCAARLEAYQAKVYTNTVKGLGQLSVRLKDADVIVLNRERTYLPRALIEKLPKLKLVVGLATVRLEVGRHADQFWYRHSAQGQNTGRLGLRKNWSIGGWLWRGLWYEGPRLGP